MSSPSDPFGSHGRAAFDQVRARIGEARVVPVVSGVRPSAAVPLARALAAGGVRVIEITLRDSFAVEVIDKLTREAPEVLVGAGTVTTVQEVSAVVEAGARFALAPGTSAAVLAAADTVQLPFVPGVSTPSEVEHALAQGRRLVKFYPAGVLGGPKGVQALLGPYRHRGLELVPTGGIGADDAGEYLRLEGVLAVGGSWLVPSDAVAAGDWGRITEIARAARSWA